MNTLFPIFLKADQTPILLVGGGEVAAEKLHFLLKSSPRANVTLVASEISDEIIEFQRTHEQLTIQKRNFRRRDIKGKKLVIVAANNPSLNERIKRLSKRRSFLLNAADKPAFCDLYLGGIVTKGDLKIAISTNGKAPVMAKRLRQFFETNLPENLPNSLDELQVLRKQLTGDFEHKLTQLNELTKDLIIK